MLHTFGLLWYERELVAYTGLKQVFVACVVDTGVKTRTQACMDNIVKRGGEKGVTESALLACVSSANVKMSGTGERRVPREFLTGVSEERLV
jgi:hypothetical protein